jgi:hypothetical protein
MDCRTVREVADSFLSEELLVETNHEVLPRSRHRGRRPPGCERRGTQHRTAGRLRTGGDADAVWLLNLPRWHGSDHAGAFVAGRAVPRQQFYQGDCGRSGGAVLGVIDHVAGTSHLSLFTYNRFSELTPSGAPVILTPPMGSR